MKKVLATILAFLYLATSTGATVHLHYCMGKLFAADLSESSSCKKCGMKSLKGDCCKNEKKLVKVKDQPHMVATSSFYSFELAKQLSENYAVHIAIEPIINLRLASYGNGPPGKSQAPLFLLHRNFRI